MMDKDALSLAWLITPRGQPSASAVVRCRAYIDRIEGVLSRQQTTTHTVQGKYGYWWSSKDVELVGRLSMLDTILAGMDMRVYE